MKKNILHMALMLLVSAAILTASSCKKDDDEQKSKTDLITSGSWKVTNMIVDPPIVMEGMEFSDLFAFMPDCAKDDFMTFHSDGTVVNDEGASKCDAGDPQTSTGTWSFNDAETQIIMQEDQGNVAYDLINLTDTNLEIGADMQVDLGSGTETYYVTMKLIKK